ncbi:hypothetical protein LguiB_009897 [Lonicera macranthoides]
MSDFVICRDFKLTLVSATDVEEVRRYFKTKVYATVTIGDNKATKKRTPTDTFNETNPKWNHTMGYTIADTDIQKPGLDLLIELYIDRTRGDKRVGHVTLPINELFVHSANNVGITRLDLPVVIESGVTKGVVTLEYSFGEEKILKKLSLVKKLVNAGTAMAVKAAIMSTTGYYVPIPIRLFEGPDIVCSKGSGVGILSEETLINTVVEVAQSF